MLWNGLREFPGTPAKIFAGIVCELLFTIVILAGLVLGRAMSLDLVIALGSIVLAFNGVTTWQYQIGRTTDRELNAIRASGPSQVNVEKADKVDIATDPASTAPSVAISDAQPTLPPRVGVMVKDD